MISPPRLIGTIFSEKEKEEARSSGRLLFISLMTDPVCNLNCPDCYVGQKRLRGDELTLAERKKVLDQARKLGARTLRIAGEGEPLLDEQFWPLVEYASNLNMNVFFFTNGTQIDKETAEKIARNRRVTAVIKFSGSPEVMERLTGQRGSFTRDHFVEYDGLLIPEYLKHMIDAGMNEPDKDGNSRLGIEFLLRKSNYGHVFDIFRWCRRNNVVPYVEQNLEAGLAESWEEYPSERVADEDAFALSKRLLEVDEEDFGFSWKPSIPYLVGGICEDEQEGCKKFTYNLVISSRGDMHPCYAACFSLGNVRTHSLQEGLNHPIRRELLDKPKYSCLCRVYSRTAQRNEVQTPEDLDTSVDYHYGGNENA